MNFSTPLLRITLAAFSLTALSACGASANTDTSDDEPADGKATRSACEAIHAGHEEIERLARLAPKMGTSEESIMKYLEAVEVIKDTGKQALRDIEAAWPVAGEAFTEAHRSSTRSAKRAEESGRVSDEEEAEADAAAFDEAFDTIADLYRDQCDYRAGELDTILEASTFTPG